VLLFQTLEVPGDGLIDDYGVHVHRFYNRLISARAGSNTNGFYLYRTLRDAKTPLCVFRMYDTPDLAARVIPS
jgi:hypothetical protein